VPVSLRGSAFTCVLCSALVMLHLAGAAQLVNHDVFNLRRMCLHCGGSGGAQHGQRPQARAFETGRGSCNAALRPGNAAALP
jgi:hypothetical protein